MSRHRLPLAIVLGATTMVALTACGAGSSSGTPAAAGSVAPTTPPPAQVMNQVKTAITGASAVHIKGKVTDSGSTVSLDIQLNKDGSASGTLGEGGMNIPIIATKQADYLQFTADLMKSSGVTATSAAGKLMLNKWVPSTSPLMSGSDMVSSIKPLLDYTSFISTLGSQIAGDNAKIGKTSTVNGTAVQLYTLSDGTTAAIATSTPHYLMELVPAASQGGGQLDFTNWNQPVTITAPPAAQIYSGPGA
jgi:hypothetical protein